MGNTIFNESSLFGGISQQNPELRLPNQTAGAINTKLSIANGVEKRPSASLLYEEADAYGINCKCHELELDADNKFILVFNNNTVAKDHAGFSTNGTKHKIITEDASVDAYLEFPSAGNTFQPDADLRLTTVLATTIITNKNVKARMVVSPSPTLGTAKYLWFNNGVQQVERTITVDGSAHVIAKSADNDTGALVDSFKTFLDGLAGYSGTKISDSIIKVTKDDLGEFTLTATDTYSDTTMKIAPIRGCVLENLPPKATDDEIIKIMSEDDVETSYYLKYDEESDSWFETIGENTNTDIDSTTMPHKIEYLEDTTGTVTGTIGEFYFYVSRITWASRTTGDEDSSPNPSFIDKTINDVFFYKNRIGFVSTDSVICSAIDDLFNFWPKTVKEVLDNDPVDRSVSTTRNVRLEYAEVFPDSMAIIGNNTQYSLHSDGKPFTNQNATMDVTTSYDVSLLAKPKAVGSSLYMVVPMDSYSSVREYAIIPDTLVTDASDITGQVPRLIPESIKQVVSESNLGHVFLIDKESYTDSYPIWSYTFYWQGNEKAQSAWSRWDLWFRPLACGVFDGKLYVLGTETRGGSLFTVMTELRLETKAVEVQNYINSEPLVDRLSLHADNQVIKDGDLAVVRVSQDLYDSVDGIDGASFILVDRLSGLSGEYVDKFENGGDYFVRFNLKVISKFNFLDSFNFNLIGQHKIGGIE